MSMKLLSDAAIAQLRTVVREEVRTEVERTLNKTFIDTVREGAEHMNSIYDAVLAFRDDVELMKRTQEVHTSALTKLQEDLEKLKG